MTNLKALATTKAKSIYDKEILITTYRLEINPQIRTNS